MKGKTGRREFLGKATFAALTLPAILQAGGLKIGQAMNESSTAASKEGKTKVKRICVEEHWGNDEMIAIRNQWSARTGFPPSIDPKTTPLVFPRLVDIEKFRLPLMDESGITMQVLSTSSPAIQGLVDAATAIATAKRTNDAMAEVIRKYPGRFAGFASLPTQDPKAAADELERSVTQLGFKGAMIQGHTNGEYLDEQKFWVLWERAAALGTPIYLHITEPLGRPERFMMDTLNSWGPLELGSRSCDACASDHRRRRVRRFPQGYAHSGASGGVASLPPGSFGRRLCNGL